MLEKTLESSLDSKEIQSVNLKEDQPWIFTGKADAEAETPILWPPDAKSWLIGKDSDALRFWGQEEKGTTEDEMPEWHHWLYGCESVWTPAVGDGQGSWCAAIHGVAKSRTWLSDWTELNIQLYICTTTSLFIHVDEHLGCFHVLAIVNNAAMYNGIYVSFSILVPQGICLGVGLLGHMVVLLLVF